MALRSFSLILVALCVEVGGSSLWAADLKAPLEFETTKVLPKGVRNPRFKNVFMSIENRFNGVGQIEPLGVKLNKGVTWDALLDKQETDAKREKLKGLIGASDVSLASSSGPGSTTGVVNTLIDVKVPVLAWGVTDRLTLAVAVPIMKVQISADTGFESNEDGNRFLNTLSAQDPVKADEVKGALTNGIQQKLEQKGYEPLRSHTVQGVGDIKLVGKYLLSQKEQDAVALKCDLTLPTGRAVSPDKAVDAPLGDGQTDFGFSLIWDRMLTESLKLNTYSGYTIQFANSVVKRIPTATESLSDVKETLRRKLGDVATAGTSLSYEFSSVGLTVGAGYSFQYLTPTIYQDGQYESYRYRLLEADSPLQALHAATLSAGFSTVDWFKAKKFVLPFQANLAYSRPLIGRNVTKNDVVTAELVLFF